MMSKDISEFVRVRRAPRIRRFDRLEDIISKAECVTQQHLDSRQVGRLVAFAPVEEEAAEKEAPPIRADV